MSAKPVPVFDEEFEPEGEEAGLGDLPPLPKSREERVLSICDGMTDIVSAMFNVSGRELRRGGRSTQTISRIRQIAMYVTHVTLEMSQKEVGQGFARDRTTVLHACHLIEDMRDDGEFDRHISLVERVALAAFGHRLEG